LATHFCISFFPLASFDEDCGLDHIEACEAAGRSIFLCTNVAIVPLDKLCFLKAQTNKLADHVKILEIVEQLSGLQDIIVDLDCTTSIDPRTIAQQRKIIFRLVKPTWSMDYVSATRLM
jgi:hypothetical protein